MERTWSNIKDPTLWTTFRQETVGGVFQMQDNISPSWLSTYWNSWEEIEKYFIDMGYTEVTQKSAEDIDPINFAFTSTNRKFSRWCTHNWITYTGFMKVETYCTLCNEVQK